MSEFESVFFPLFSYYLSMTLGLSLTHYMLLLFIVCCNTFVFWKIKEYETQKKQQRENIDLKNFESEDGVSYGNSTISLFFDFDEDFARELCPSRTKEELDEEYTFKMSKIIQKCPKLESLFISDCPFLTDKTIHILTRDNLEILEKLEILSLENCLKLGTTDNSPLLEFINSCQRVRVLSLEGCSNVSKSLLRSIHLIRLEELDLSNCKNNDRTVMEILTNHPLLTKLKITHVPSLVILRVILNEYLNLKSLDILGLNFC